MTATPSTNFFCPITHELMKDPVIDPDGNSYERQAIEDWLRQNGSSPITRAPLSINDLRPNRALKQTIAEYCSSIQSNNQTDNSSTATNNLTTAEEIPYDLTVSANYVNGFVHISILPPPDKTRSPCDICCVVDTSGSMAVQAEIKNDSREQYGLSQLDLVKHALKTVIHSLQPQDRLAVVSFANNATVLFELTKMDADGKSSALAALARLEDNGQTNLWDGLRSGLEVLSRGQRAVGSNAALFLLTDGCPNVEPPRGHLPTLEKLKKKTKFTCSINTFGFGYSLDSKLLEDLAILGNSGSYAFIPDGSFVGTIFVNAITTILTTIATNVEISVHGQPIEPSDYTRWYTTSVNENDTVFQLGAITYGQSKDLLIPISSEKLVKNQFSLIYDTLHEKRKTIQFSINTNPEANAIQHIEQQKFRLRLVHCVRTVFEAKRSDTKDLAKKKQQIEIAMQQLKAFEEEFKQYPIENDEYVKDLLADLNGQIEEAISKDEWFDKWGIHFLPSLTRAHLLQYCNNFKDPGVQHYGNGTLFAEIRDEMDSIFCGLPAPKPAPQVAQGTTNSGYYSTTTSTIDMSAYHDANAGCFHGECTVRLMDGTITLVKNIKPGDQIAPHGGVVNYVVKTKCPNNKAKMIVFDNGLIITAWHPIRLNQQWIMPCSLASGPTEISCEEVYNFALDQGHTVLVNDVECVTLGHGFKDDIVRHSYYGTKRVIEDLRRLDNEQHNSGIIQITANDLIRSQTSGLVAGVKRFCAKYQQEISAQ